MAGKWTPKGAVMAAATSVLRHTQSTEDSHTEEERGLPEAPTALHRPEEPRPACWAWGRLWTHIETRDATYSALKQVWCPGVTRVVKAWGVSTGIHSHQSVAG